MSTGPSARTLAFALLAALTGCGKPQPAIVLDSGWDAESAQRACEGASDWFRQNAVLITRVGCERFISCQPMTVLVNACSRDPIQQVRDFEAELAKQLAATPECRSLPLIIPANPGANQAASDAMKRQHWSLGLDFSPGAQKQQWTMTNSADQMSFAQGEGDPQEIAVEVCTLARLAPTTSP